MNARNENVLRMQTGMSVLGAETSVSGTALVIQGPTNPLFAGTTGVLVSCALALFAAVCLLLPPRGATGQTCDDTCSVETLPASVIQTVSDASPFFGNVDPFTAYWDRRCICGPMSSKARRKIRRTRAEIQEERRKLLDEDQPRDRRDRPGVPRETAPREGQGHRCRLRPVQLAIPGFLRRPDPHAVRSGPSARDLHPARARVLRMAVRGYQDRRPAWPRCARRSQRNSSIRSWSLPRADCSGGRTRLCSSSKNSSSRRASGRSSSSRGSTRPTATSGGRPFSSSPHWTRQLCECRRARPRGPRRIVPSRAGLHVATVGLYREEVPGEFTKRKRPRRRIIVDPETNPWIEKIYRLVRR